MSQYQILIGQERIENKSFGFEGGVVMKTTVAVTPATGTMFFAVSAKADAVFAAQGNVTGSTNHDLTALTKLGAGDVVFGRWNSLTLASGEIVAYQTALR
jgi:hypothetical protein